MNTVQVPVELIQEIVDNQGRCWHDHHGYCQEHNLQSGEECWVYRLTQILADAKDQKEVPDANKPHLLVNKFVPGDRVRNTLSADNDWVRAGDSGIVVEYEHERYPDGDIEVLVHWDDPVDQSGRNEWWVMESELELAK